MGGIVPWMGGGTYVPSFPSSAIPQQQTPPQSSLREWWRELNATKAAPEPPSRVQSAVMGLRHNGESAAVGALLAFVDTDLGGLDFAGRIPLDWAASVLLYALSVRDAGDPEGLSTDFRAMGQACTSVATYRMIHKWREGQKAIPRNPPADAILKAGKVSF